MSVVNIALIMDQQYLIPTSVTIYSIVANKKKDTKYRFYVISDMFNIDLCRKLKAFSAENIEINLIQHDTTGFEKLHDPSKSSYCVASPTALLKFKIADLLKNLEKCLYLDGDLIVRTDLSNLFNVNIDEHVAAIVEDTGSLYSGNKTVKKYKNYFNSGVMLLNLKKLREENASEKLFDLKKASHQESLMDQNIFNEYFCGRVKLLDVSYNCLYVNLVRSRSKFSLDEYNKKFHKHYKDIKDIARDAQIIHYSSKDKPWKYSNIPLADEWQSYYFRYCNHFGFDSGNLQLDTSKNYRNDEEYLPQIRENIIISLTSFPDRIKTVHFPIEDALNQSIKPEAVFLYLSKEQFPKLEKDLPQDLLNLQRNGLRIIFVEEDIKAHKKYFYAFKNFSNKIIITIDDDLRYDRFMIERLIISHYKNPRAIIASRVHLITGNRNKESIDPYSEWRKEYNGWINIPSHQLLATHGAGTLFPPYCINIERLCNLDDIKKLSLAADDMWLKVNEVLSNTPIVLAATHKKLNIINGSQETALWKTNVTKNENDIQLNKILNKYNRINSKETVIKRIFESSPFPNKKYQSNEGAANNFTKDFKAKLALCQEELAFQKERNARLKNTLTWKIGKIVTFIPQIIFSLLRK